MPLLRPSRVSTDSHLGYWSLGPAFLQGTPFQKYASVYTNAWARVVRAINAAEKYKLGVRDSKSIYGTQADNPLRSSLMCMAHRARRMRSQALA